MQQLQTALWCTADTRVTRVFADLLPLTISKAVHWYTGIFIILVIIVIVVIVASKGIADDAYHLFVRVEVITRVLAQVVQAAPRERPAASTRVALQQQQETRCCSGMRNAALDASSTCATPTTFSHFGS